MYGGKTNKEKEWFFNEYLLYQRKEKEIKQAEERKVTKGSLVYSENQAVSELAIISEGRLVAVNKAGRIEFKKGLS